MYLFSIAYSALVSLDNKVVIYGGYEKLPENAVRTVAAFSDGKWTKIGDLNQRRDSHNGVVLGTDVIIVGGHGKL